MTSERRTPISKRYMVIIVVMVASCIVLVGISYLMLDILSGMVVTPKTRVKEMASEGVLFVPIEGGEILSMQVSGNGRLLAYIEMPVSGGSAVLRVAELDSDGRTIFEQEIGGKRLAWLGDTSDLVFEDGGDIHLLEAEAGEQENLTASPAYDSDPIPSPDGRYILWTVSPPAAAGEPSDFWLMQADGADKAFLAEAQALAVWDSSGGRVMSRHKTSISAGEGLYRYFLKTAVPGGQGWEHYADCDGEVSFIWWPSRDTVLYVGPLLVKEQDMVKGVWSRVEQPDRIKKVASTDGLGYSAAYYSFYPSRRDGRLVYVGEKGLEYLDYEERVIYRYPQLEARIPLAWNEVANEIYYVGPEGIYRVGAGG
jgi:hypothetical protein